MLGACCDAQAPFDGAGGKLLLGKLDLAFLGAYAASMFCAGHLGDRLHLRKFLAAGMLASAACVACFGATFFLEVHALWYFLAVQVLGGAHCLYWLSPLRMRAACHACLGATNLTSCCCRHKWLFKCMQTLGRTLLVQAFAMRSPFALYRHACLHRQASLHACCMLWHDAGVTAVQGAITIRVFWRACRLHAGDGVAVCCGCGRQLVQQGCGLMQLYYKTLDSA
jgi:hypothetical protein